MNPLLFIALYIVFIAVFALLKIYYSYRNRIKDNVLQDALKTADQYEIAILKGGKDLVIKLAFYHLLKAGYFEKSESNEVAVAKYRFKAITSKDISQLSDIEKEILIKFAEPTSLAGCLLMKRLSALEKLDLKLFKLSVRCLVKNTIVVCEKLYVIFAWIASVVYLIFGEPHHLGIKMFNIGLVNIWSGHIIWGQILGSSVYFDGQLLTSSGKRYIKLFETQCFPLPDFKSDAVYKEAVEDNPCSV